MTKFKRTLIGTMSALLIISLMPVYALQANAAEPYISDHRNNISMELDEDGVLTISGRGEIEYKALWWNDKVTKIVIEDGVTGIGRSAFCKFSSLETVEIPNSVTYIDNYAFWICESLTSVTMSDSVTRIEREAFWNCTSLASIEIPNSVTSIGAGAFCGCASLTSIVIPDSVTSIGEGAFLGCSSLASIEIPDTVTEIGNAAFGQCTGLRSVTLSGCPTFDIWDIFTGCTSVEEINVPENDTVYSSADGVLFNKDKTELVYCPYAKQGEYIIPQTVEVIRDRAFENCSSLVSVSFPDSLKELSADAFFGCTAMTAINVCENNSVFSSVDGVLYNKDKTAIIRCPEAKAGEYTIPDSVKSISEKAFRRCTLLTAVYMQEGINTIGSDAFRGCSSIESVKIPDSVTDIGSGAFAGCSSLVSVSFPNNYKIHSIEDHILSDCTSLESVSVPYPVEKIGSCAFSGCASLKSVFIPKSVWKIADNAFSGCPSLADIAVEEGNTNYSAEDGALYSWNKKSIIFCCKDTEECTIPEGVENIDSNAFAGCSKLRVLNVPSSVTDIENGAFIDCTALETVNISRDNKVYENRNGIYVYKRSSSELIFCSRAAKGYCVISRGTQNICSGAFAGCDQITTIAFAGDINNIFPSAFLRCSSLGTVIMQKGTRVIASNAFGGCPLTDLYYTGSRSDWDKISCRSNSIPSSVKLHFDSEVVLREKGDIDGDGIVTLRDSCLMKRIILAVLEPGADDKYAADMNGDGAVNTLDAFLLKRMLIMGK